MKFYLSPTPMNPVSRLVAAVLAALLLAGAFFLGVVVLAVLVGILFLSGLAIWLRSWWLRRGKAPGIRVETPPVRPGQVIDAEYTVISRRRN